MRKFMTIFCCFRFGGLLSSRCPWRLEAKLRAKQGHFPFLQTCLCGGENTVRFTEEFTLAASAYAQGILLACSFSIVIIKPSPRRN